MGVRGKAVGGPGVPPVSCPALEKALCILCGEGMRPVLGESLGTLKMAFFNYVAMVFGRNVS